MGAAELAVTWPGLADAEARVAARLRTFVLTRDPLDQLERLDPAWATANGDGDDYEVVLYLSLSNALTLAELDGTTVAEVLARLAESVVVVGAEHEQLLRTGAYPTAVRRRAAEPLLADPVADLPGADADRRWPSPNLGMASAGWEPIGLGAIQDLVQAEFGPVDLDRTTVRLTPADTATPGCPACRGDGFGFPADLHDHLPAMRAALDAAEPPRSDDPEAFGARVTADAQLILDLAAHYEVGAPFDDLLEGDEELAWRLGDWLTNTLFGLGTAGQDELLVPVGEAVQRLDPDNAPLHASDLAVALAERGRPEALDHAVASVRARPDDVWMRLHLGDVHRNLGDPTRAEEVYSEAVSLVAETGAPVDVRDAYQRLMELLAGQPGRDDEVAALEEECVEVVRRREAMQRTRRRSGPKVGRNEPCPCGSGQKYKRCHGA